MSTPLLRAALDIQAAALLADNVREVRRRKPRLVRTGVTNIVAANLLKEQAQFLN